RIGDIIVARRVNHDRGTSGTEDSTRSAKRESGHEELEVQRAGGREVDVRKVACVKAVDALEAMTLVANVEMVTGTGERGITLPVLMDVNGVGSKSEACHGGREQHASTGILECRRPNLYPGDVANGCRCADRRDWLWRRCRRRRRWRGRRPLLHWLRGASD